MSRIVRINDGNYSLYVQPGGTIWLHGLVKVDEKITVPTVSTTSVQLGVLNTTTHNITNGVELVYNTTNQSLQVANQTGTATITTNNVVIDNTATINHLVITTPSLSFNNTSTLSYNSTSNLFTFQNSSGDLSGISANLIGSPVVVDDALLLKSRTTDVTTTGDGGVLYYKPNSESVWVTNVKDEHHMLVTNRRAFAYSMIF